MPNDPVNNLRRKEGMDHGFTPFEIRTGDSESLVLYLGGDSVVVCVEIDDDTDASLKLTCEQVAEVAKVLTDWLKDVVPP